VQASHGQDPEYDRALHHYFWTYHNLVDLMVRVAVNEDAINKLLIDLSAIVGLDGVPLHFQLFPKLWLDIYNSRNIERSTLATSISLLVIFFFYKYDLCKYDLYKYDLCPGGLAWFPGVRGRRAAGRAVKPE
jgi:hypothetical protein